MDKNDLYVDWSELLETLNVIEENLKKTDEKYENLLNALDDTQEKIDIYKMAVKKINRKELLENISLMRAEVEWEYPMDYAATLDELEKIVKEFDSYKFTIDKYEQDIVQYEKALDLVIRENILNDCGLDYTTRSYLLENDEKLLKEKISEKKKVVLKEIYNVN